MRAAPYILLALSLLLIISWATVYSRDNSVFGARGSAPLTLESDSMIGLWLLEGYVNMSVFVPNCHRLSLVVYSKGGGELVYRLDVEALERPLREVYIFKTPRPGYYIIEAKLREIEGCVGPRVNGALNVYQNAQPETTTRTVLLVPAVASLIIALTLMVVQQVRSGAIRIKP